MKKMISRRSIFMRLATGLAAITLGFQGAAQSAEPRVPELRQSVMVWCFKDIVEKEEFFRECVKLGIEAVEGLSPADYPLAQSHGLKIAMVNAHKFHEGPVDPKDHDLYVAKIKAGVDLAVKVGAENVIIFSGFRKEGLSDEVMTQSCIAVWKEAASYAEQHEVQLVLEQLNTRDDTHPMRGHPGYFADDIDKAAAMIRAVDSPNVKLLYDIYHVSIMNGDIIRRMRQYADIIGHVHTAGNPGRGPLDESQEIYYPAVLRALAELKFKGYVAHEFLPSKEKSTALRELKDAVEMCRDL